MPQLDIDLAARQEARELARQAGAAQERLNELDQGALDAIVAAMAAAFEPECAALAKMAVEETGFGNTQDKTEKNLFACKTVLSAIAPMKTKGILREIPEKRLWEIGVPMGVIAAIVPSTIHTSADVPGAIAAIVRSKTFDNGTVCASEQSIIVEKSMESAVLEEAGRQGIYLMPTEEAGRLARLLFKPTGGLNPEIVGKSAIYLAEKAGFSVPKDTKVLMAREQEAGPTRPYSMEKLCPVLAFFVLDSEDAVLQKAVEVLRHEGSGHTFAIHARDEGVIRRFALEIPVSRFLVNAPAALGGIGAATGLFPALTLGCGAVGGSSSSNNISPMDLINLRRVAWGTEAMQQKQEHDSALVEMLTQKILERLG